MSGGSYDYAYEKVNNFIYRCEEEVTRLETGKSNSKWEEDFDPTPDDLRAAAARRKFMKHLENVAEAMRAIEWVDSCDSCPGYEVEKIEECLNKDAFEALDWIRQTVHRAHHEGPLNECRKSTCKLAMKVLGTEEEGASQPEDTLSGGGAADEDSLRSGS